eukprot:TRINITY_DN762_c0_g1_i2.p1 TRINITY_DN762_c0_g1~~TRINITY_DN762_c0_g1_i2.p1  ORF type:complete len:349 (-),score=44.40 TRINITY_DN762_c0_g1_i2:771-1817(-)
MHTYKCQVHLLWLLVLVLVFPTHCVRRTLQQHELELGVDAELDQLLDSIVFNPDTDMKENAERAFDKLVAKEGEQADFTPHELLLYKQRFEEELGYDCTHERCMNKDVWKRSMLSAMVDQQPIITEKEVAETNHANLSWTAKYYPEFENISFLDSKLLIGRNPDGDGSDNDESSSSVMESNVTKKVRRQRRSNRSNYDDYGDYYDDYGDYYDDYDDYDYDDYDGEYDEFDLPSSFSAAEVWPRCVKSIKNIRNQGKCGSCWANAVAKMLTIKVCTNEGPQGFGGSAVSAQYILSCFSSKENGCRGDAPARALNKLKEQRLPTENCVPYLMTGVKTATFGCPFCTRCRV